ncbi:PREDICTED: uncharacterized protein LOC104725667 [Camelina sativa]|uniref:Uncharacterized protein LOC104725667 n=1 Tax=Camelina sativa TaxID=90675 RepID=A0ABM1QLI3_CAMSA|nr:PREDICTED: uncharacterized protein LOC104725667 [Camelina sativa]
MSDLLANVDSPITERSLVIHMLNELSEKFDNIHNVIKHKSPFPSFAAARSMLLLEEEHLNKPSKQVTSAPLGISTPHLLYTDASPATPSSYPATNNRNSSPQHFPPQTNRGHHNRGRGRGRNTGYRGRGRHNPHHNSWMPQPPSYWPAPPPHQQWNQQQWRPSPMAYHVSTTLPPNTSILGAYPPAVPQGPPMPTVIPPNIAQAFGTMTLQNPQDSNWYMDTVATAHIPSEPGTLLSVFNSSTIPSITVGNGSSLPTTSIGYHYLPSKTRPLHLNNVLVCPSIIKNLVSIRQFTTDNWVSIEFDPFGFLVKDLSTRTPLLRCDSSGSLYSITNSSTPLTSPQDFLSTSVSSTVWHRRLGHPGNSILNSLISTGSIKCSKPDSSLCHACQLGKHIHLPFDNSDLIISEPFQIIHSDVWTSPVSSISGIKYYVIS